MATLMKQHIAEAADTFLVQLNDMGISSLESDLGGCRHVQRWDIFDFYGLTGCFLYVDDDFPHVFRDVIILEKLIIFAFWGILLELFFYWLLHVMHL